MAERFTKLFELPGGLYAAGAPVLIRAGVLLRDSVTRNVIAQLKFYNLDARTIRSLKLTLVLWDGEGNMLGEELPRSYTNLRAAQDEEFGQRTALLLPYREAVSFSTWVSEVVFADGTRWKDSGFWFRISGVFFTLKALGTLLAPNMAVFFLVQLFQPLGWGHRKPKRVCGLRPYYAVFADGTVFSVPSPSGLRQPRCHSKYLFCHSERLTCHSERLSCHSER